MKLEAFATVCLWFIRNFVNESNSLFCLLSTFLLHIFLGFLKIDIPTEECGGYKAARNGKKQRNIE